MEGPFSLPRTPAVLANGLKDVRLYIYLINTGSFFALLSGFSHKADLFCQFRLQMGVLLAFVTLVLALSYKQNRWPKLLAVTAFSTALNMVAVGLTCFDFSRETNLSSLPAGEKLSILQFNVESSNQQKQKLVDLVHDLKPDVVCLQEYDSTWWEALKQLNFKTDYPYEISKIRNDNFGVAIFSKRPLLSSSIEGFGRAHVPTALAKIAIGDGSKTVTVMSTHPVPPLTGEWYDLRNEQFDLIAKYVKSHPTESYIICGDLNCAPWSAHFGNLLSHSGLRDSRSGSGVFGIQPTWPVNCWILRIPLDHILTARNIETKVRRVERDCGSDHLPVYAEFELR